MRNRNPASSHWNTTGSFEWAIGGSRARSIRVTVLVGAIVFLQVLSGTVPFALGAADQHPSGTITWSNGDSLLGELTAANASQLKWKSPVFEQAFVVDTGYVRSVRFPSPNRATSKAMTAAAGSYRIVMHSDDVLYGRIVVLDEKRIVVSSPGHGQVALDRAAVKSLRRLVKPSMTYEGPNGVLGWRTINAARRVAEWKVGDKGELSTTVAGAELFRSIDLPTISEIDIALSWRGKPGFLITFATPSAIRLSQPTVKVETWDDELVLQTLRSNGDFTQIKTLTDEIKSIRLRLLWNQQNGELDVYSEFGEPLGKMRAGSDAKKSLSGLYIRNRGTDLTVEDVRVSSWDGAKPLPGKRARGPVTVRLEDGSTVQGTIRAYDHSRQMLTVSSSSGSRQLKMDRVSAIDLGTSKNRDSATEPGVRVSHFNGTRLSGKLSALKNGALQVKTDYSAQPIACPLAGVLEVKFLKSTALRNSHESILEFRGTKLHGTLAPVGPQGRFGWQPVGSKDSLELATEHPARIIRQPQVSGNERQPHAMMDVVYLRNGDMVPCRVEDISETHLRVAPVFTRSGRIARQKVKAVEFNSDQQQLITGFDDPGWVIQKQHENAVQRDGDQFVFRGTATLSHPELLQADDIQFDVKWGSGETPTVMTFGFFTQKPKRVSSQYHLIMYFLRNQLYLQGRADGQRPVHVVRPMQLPDQRAKIRMSLKDDHLEVFVGKNRVIRQTLSRKNRSDKGFVMNVQQSGNRRGMANLPVNLVTVSNLRVGSSGLFGSRDIDDEKLQLVLTVPRSRKKNPPTHVLVARNGDLLRGRLVAMSDRQVEFRSRLDAVTLPRERLASVIWLDDEKQNQAQAKPIGKHNMQAILLGGAKFSFNADKIEDDHIVGQHPHFGACRLPMNAVREIHIGNFEEAGQVLAYAGWELRPAKEPQFAGGTPGAHGSEFGLDSPLVGTMAKDFQTELADGSEFHLRDHAGRVVVLDFWATWCGPCVRAMPAIIESISEFSDDEVILIAVNQQESVETIREFLTARELTATVALDPDGDIGRLFQVEAIPQTVIIGKDGKIERLHIGAHPNIQEELKQALQTLTNPAAQPAPDETVAG